MTIGSVFYQVLLLSSLMATGYALCKMGWLQKEHSDFLTKLLLNLLVPCTVLNAVQNDLNSVTAGQILLAIVCVMGLMMVCTWAVYYPLRACKADEDEALVISRSVPYPNNAFIGIPLCAGLFGAEGTVWAVVNLVCTNIYLFLFVMNSFAPKGSGSTGEKLKKLLTPLNITSVTMLVMLAAGWKFPDFAARYCGYFGSCTAAIAMLVIGFLLASHSLTPAFKRPIIYAVTLGRNIAVPLLMALLMLITGWTEVPTYCFTICMGCSAASTVSIIGAQYGRAPGLASQIMLQTNIFLPLTLPLVMAIVTRMVGFF